jgi:hypothetical protein
MPIRTIRTPHQFLIRIATSPIRIAATQTARYEYPPHTDASKMAPITYGAGYPKNDTRELAKGLVVPLFLTGSDIVEIPDVSLLSLMPLTFPPSAMAITT